MRKNTYSFSVSKESLIERLSRLFCIRKLVYFACGRSLQKLEKLLFEQSFLANSNGRVTVAFHDFS